MNVTVNSETREAPEGATLLTLIEQLGFSPKQVVAELNGEIVPRGGYASAVLNDSDQVELVRIVGGG